MPDPTEQCGEHDIMNRYTCTRMITRVRREAAAEQREKDAQIAEQFGDPEPSRRFSPEHWDEWRERTSITIAAAIREQGNDA